MNSKHNLSFIFEYIVVILLFSIFAAVCTSIISDCYLENRMNSRKQMALEYGCNLIEEGNIPYGGYHLDDEMNIDEKGDYLVEVIESDTGFEHEALRISYKEETLITLEFFRGNGHE